MSFNIVGKRNLRSALEQKARAHADRTFLIFEGADESVRRYTYGQFDRLVNRLANGLLQRGVRKGDKVNVHLTNCPEFVICWFAIAKIGAVMVPTNPLSPPDELGYPVNHSEAVLTVTQPDLLRNVQAIRQSCPHLREILLCHCSETPEGVIGFERLLERQPEELKEVPLKPDDEAAILYTSGTTSRPKGVLVTHANYIYLGEAISKTIRLGPEDRHLVVLPLFHGNAQYYSVMTTLNVGASAALMARFSASRCIKQAIRHRCTVTSLLATPIRMILAQPHDPADRNNQLRLVIFAQSVTEAQLQEWDERFAAPLQQIYGMTETMGQPLANPLDYSRDNMSIGMVTLGYECRVVDDSGQDVAEGEAGQLLVRGTPGCTIMKGYFKDPDNTANAIRDGWLWTGDVVEVNEQGYFRFVDRAKDLIRRSGENVSAGEVEAVIKQHPAVADVAVVGIPEELRDETIQAFVILGPGESAAEKDVIEFCQERLSKFRVPEFVEFREEFPRTSLGKIRKNILRDEGIAGRKG